MYTFLSFPSLPFPSLSFPYLSRFTLLLFISSTFFFLFRLSSYLMSFLSLPSSFTFLPLCIFHTLPFLLYSPSCHNVLTPFSSFLCFIYSFTSLNFLSSLVRNRFFIFLFCFNNEVRSVAYCGKLISLVFGAEWYDLKAEIGN